MPEVQKYTYNVAMDIISRHDVDGLNFDYVRYSGKTWGYHTNTLERFRRRYNFAGTPATVLKFQLHDHIARKFLHQPPQRCSYAGNKQVGAFLKGIMEKGGTEDWRKVLRDATGENLSTRAMVEYYQPLLGWLQEQNRGRQIGWE